jgi:hypothetical protein
LISVQGIENVPRKPFAQWADIPTPKQFIVTPWFMEGEAYHIWRGSKRENINYIQRNEDYGIDYTQGIIALQYGIAEKWAADLALGYTTVGTRSFDINGEPRSTSGLMDIPLGVRYQVWTENLEDGSWQPTLTLRAGGILPGIFKRDFPFAPGMRSAAIEPSVLVKKHFGWEGFGAYADVLFRWNRTTGRDQYIVATGFMQDISRWTFNVGYRHLQTLSGDSIQGAGIVINYSPEIRENSHAIEAGFNYCTKKQQINLGFHTRKVLDGVNTASTLWMGVYADFPLGGK